MKKLFLVLLISVGLILAITGCSSTVNSDESADNEAKEELGLTKPVSDVTDGTGLQGTWEATDDQDNTTVTSVLALNSDDTYELWIGSNSSSAVNVESVISGTYTSTDTQLTLTPQEGAGQPAVYNYTLDGNNLDLQNVDGSQTLKLTRQES